MPHHPDPEVNAARIERSNQKALASKYPIAIIAAGRPVRYRGSQTAPGDGVLIKWATALNGAFVTRFYPSKKGWLIIDVRNAQFFQMPNGFGKWQGHVRSTTPLPSMEAAIMVATLKLAGHSSLA